MTIEQFKHITTQNGYYFLDDDIYLNYKTLEENEIDNILGYRVDDEGALLYKIEYHQFEKEEIVKENYLKAMEYLKQWNDEKNNE